MPPRRDLAVAMMWLSRLARIEGDCAARDACVAVAYRHAGVAGVVDRLDLHGEALARWRDVAPHVPRHDRTEGW